MNIRVCFFYLSLSLISITARAQLSPKDTSLLQKKIATAKEDSDKVALYITLADFLTGRGATGPALAVAQKAWLLSNKLKYNHGLVISLTRYGSVYEEITKDYSKAIDYYKQAIKIAETNRLYADINLTYGSILNMYYYLGNYPGAMIIAQKGLAAAEQRNDKEMIAHYNNQMGFIYLKQEKPAEAIKYYRQYLNLARGMGNQMVLADAFNCMSDIYFSENDQKTALEYLFDALDIYKNVGTRKTIYKKNGLKNDGPGKSDRVSYTLFKISNVYKQQGRYPLSLQYALKGLNYHDGRHIPSFNQYDLASYYINIGDVYRALKNYKNAMHFLNKGLLLSKTILHREDILDAYNGLSKTYALQKYYDSAYHYQLLFAVLKDSIINENASRAIEQVRSRFESDKKDKEIALLKQQQKIKQTEAENRALVLNILIGFFILSAVISYLIVYIRNNKKQQQQAYEKQLAVQAERQRISGDMHDDIGTGLSTMLIYINLLKSKLKGGADYPDVERVAAMGDGLVAQMKEIVWSLNPVNDSLESLLIFIRLYFAQLFEHLPYRTSIVFPASIPDVALKGVIRRNIYLSIKEALNNIIKHANASYVELKIELQQDELIIYVKDNGKGFPDNQDGQFFSNGLKNMQRRMEQINGRFKFFNDGGASISIELGLDRYPNG